jgi:predicted site-specific integrase-resolvase
MPAETIAYNVEAAAQLIGISRAGLYRYIQAGDLKVRKIGARTVVLRQDLERFVKSEPPARGRKFPKK